MRDVIGARMRWELLHLVVATFEATWIFVWMRALQRAGSPTFGFGWLLLYAFAMVTWSRFLLATDRGDEWRRRASLAGALIGMVVVAQAAFASTVGVFNLGDLSELLLAPWHLLTSGPSPLAVTGSGLLVLWFRMIHVTQEPLSFHFTAYRFRLGVLLLFAGLIAGRVSGTAVSVGTVFLYFGAGLIAIALARAEQMSESTTGRMGLPFTWRWVGVLTGTLALTLGAGWFVARTITYDDLNFLKTVGSPVLYLVQRVLYYAGLVVFYLLSPLIIAFIELIQSLELEPLEQTDLDDTLLDQSEMGEMVAPAWTEHPLVDVIGDVVPILIVLLLLLLIVRQLRRRQQPGDVSESATRSTVIAEGANFSFGDLLSRGRDGMNRLLNRITPRGWFGTQTVEDLYRNVLVWGARHGVPRATDETPYEYVISLRNSLDADLEAVWTITEAYVDRRYGTGSVSDDELARLRRAWQQLNAVSVQHHDAGGEQ